jgi:hypothetical protein
MSKHAAPATPLTQVKERMAKLTRNNLHQCYGKRCTTHTDAWYAWNAGTAL